MIRKHQAIVASKRLILKGVLRGLHFIKKLKPTQKHRLQSIFSLAIFFLLAAVTTLFLTRPAKADSSIGFNENNGTTVHDSQTNSTGSITSTTWKSASECLVDSCLYFNGSSYVNFGNNTNWNFAAATNFTIELWFKTPAISSGTRVLISKYNATAAGYKIYMSSDGRINFGIDDAATGFPKDLVTSIARYDDSLWHHLSAIKTGTSSISLYLDGQFPVTNSTIASTGTLSNSDNFYIGIDGNGSSNGFLGFIDEMHIYTTTARSATQVKSDAQKTSTKNASNSIFSNDIASLNHGLVSYWKFDETSTPSIDSTGNSNSLTWSGNTAIGSGKFGNGVSFDGSYDQTYINSPTAIPNKNAWYNPNWAYRIKVTFNNSASSSDLTDFPVLVKLDSTRIDYNHVQSLGQDIRFTSSDNATSLPYEIESWNPSGSSYVWVKVPTITAGSTTGSIWMYYNNPNASDAQSVSTVWDSNYIAVWHMGESSGTLIDSTSYGNNLTSSNGTPDYNQTGKIGKAINFTSSSNEYFTSATTTLNNLPSGNTYYVIETWFKGTTIGGGLLGWGNWGAGYTVNALKFGGCGYVNYWWNQDLGAGGCLSSGTWYHVAATYDGSTRRILQNGVSIGNDSPCCHNAQNTGFSLGRTNNSEYFNGVMDEVRISKTGRSTDWMKAQYLSMSDTFNTYSSEQPYSLSATISIAAWVKATTLDNTQRMIIARGSSPSFDWGIGASATSSGKLWYTADGEANKGTSTATLTTGIWNHVVMVDDGSTTKLYINGTLDSQTPNSGALPATSSISVGSASNGIQGWAGQIDDARIYNRALSPLEIQQLYNWSPGPVGWWKLDEGSGNTTVDSSGNNNYSQSNITPGAGGWTTGKYGKAYNFDGADTFVDNGTGSSLADLPTLTVSAWIKPKSMGESNQGVIVAKDSSVNTQGWRFVTNNASNHYLQFNVDFGTLGGTNNLDVYSDINSLDLNSWQYVTVVWDGSTNASNVKFYKNGILLNHSSDTNASSTRQSDAAGDLIIGNQINQGNTFDGSIDDVKVYNYQRTQAQIIEDMNAGHPAPGSPIGSALIHYSFEDGQGDVVHNLGSLGSTYDGDMGGGTTCPSAGCPSWTNSGISGAALAFTNNSVSEVEGNGTSSVYNTPAFTYSAWIYRTGATPAGGGGIFGRWETNEGAFLWVNPSDVIGFPVGVGPHLSSGVTANLNTWYHVVGTFDGTNSTIYINGVKKATQPDSVTYVAITKTMEVGRYNTDDSTHFVGTIDETKFYNFALTEDQVKAEYNQGVSQVMGSVSTTSTGTPDNSAAAAYCIPGDTASCPPPVVYLSMDENQGTTANDFSGNSNSGTISGATWTTGKIGSGLSFDGINDSVTLPTSFTTGTVSFWFKLKSYPASDWLSLFDGGGTEGITIQVDTSHYLNVRSDGAGGGAGSNDTLNLNQWYHVYTYVSSIGTTTPTLYLNGVQQTNAGTGWWSEAGNAHIGSRADGTANINAIIDDFKIYNYARTPAQIAWDYNHGAPIAQYDFDECTGSTLHDVTPKSDRGVTGYNGTITPNSGRTAGSCSSGVSTEMWNGGTTGKYSSSLAFDGNGDYVSVPNLTISGKHATYAAWIKVTDYTDWRALIRNTGTPAEPQFYLFISKTGDSHAGKITAAFANNNGAESNSVIPLDTWTHVAAVYDGTNINIKIYINGILDKTFITGNNNFNFTGVNLGAQATPTTELFKGQMDDVRIYNYALNPTQIKTLYNNNSAVKF